MRPLKDKLLVERCKKQEEPGKILVLNEKPDNKFIVLGIGEACKIAVTVGCTVMIESYGLNPVQTEDGRDLYVVKEDSVYLVLKD